MRETTAAAGARAALTKGFEAIADAIMYRWSVERDVWVSPREVEHARAYLQHLGITTTALPDGRFTIEGEAAAVYDPAPLVMLGLRHLHAARRAGRAD